MNSIRPVLDSNVSERFTKVYEGPKSETEGKRNNNVGIAPLGVVNH